MPGNLGSLRQSWWLFSLSSLCSLFWCFCYFHLNGCILQPHPFLLLKRSNLGLLWVVNWSMHGIGQFILEVITSLLECVRTCLPREVRGFQRSAHMNGNRASHGSCRTQIMPVLFSDAHTHSFSYCGPCSSTVIVFIKRWPHLTGHMPGMTSAVGIWKKPTISLEKIRL